MGSTNPSTNQKESGTGQRAPAESLRIQEFQQLAERASDFYARLDPEGRFLYVNEAADGLFGLAPDEFMEKSLDQVDLPRNLSEKCAELLAQVCETGEPRSAQVGGSADSSEYLLRLVPAQSDNGAVESALCMVREVSETQDSRPPMMANGASMGRVLDPINEGVYIVNQEHEILYANPTLLEEFGRINGQKCYEYLHDRESVCPWCHFDEVLNGETVTREQRYDKVGKTFEMVSFPVKDPDGRIGKMKFFRDKTKPREIPEALRNEDSLVKELLTRIPAGVCIIDASSGEFRLWNQRAEEIWRGSEDQGAETRGELIKRLYTPDGEPIPEDKAPLTRAVSEGLTTDNEEFLFQRADGSMATLLVNASPIRDEKGDIIAGVAVITDITDRKRVEEALRKTSQELDQRVRKRTAELARTNEALRSEVKERERAQARIRATSSILQLFIHASEREAYLTDVAELLQNISNCGCVGIRVIDEEGRIPYEASLGFDEDFLESECWLQLGRDQCVCSRVIAQEPVPPEAPAMTPAGSFYSNNTLEFLESLSEEQQDSYRGRCIEEGFSSLAVVPVWYQGRTIGAVHLADPQPGQVSAETVEFVESITPVLGEAVHRFEVEKDLRDTNSLLERIFDTTHVLVAYLDPEFNFIRVNRAYAETDGRSQEYFRGKNHFDLYPHEENEVIFRRVVQTGEPYFVYAKAFEHPRQPERGLTYWDWSLLPVKNEVGEVEGVLLTLLDVTERVKMHEKLREYQSELRSLASELSMAEHRERRRIATNLHDDVSQTLALAQMRLGALESSLEGEEVQETVQQVRDFIGRSLHRTRSLTFDLSPPMLYEMGLEAALERLVDRMRDEHPMEFCFRDEGKDTSLPTDLRVNLYRAVRELIINAVKYSKAERIEVVTRGDDATFCVDVKDDGVGFDHEEIGFHRHKEGGFGLFNIQERIRHLGGEFELQTSPGEGTRATLRISPDTGQDEG